MKLCHRAESNAPNHFNTILSRPTDPHRINNTRHNYLSVPVYAAGSYTCPLFFECAQLVIDKYSISTNFGKLANGGFLDLGRPTRARRDWACDGSWKVAGEH